MRTVLRVVTGMVTGIVFLGGAAAQAQPDGSSMGGATSAPPVEETPGTADDTRDATASSGINPGPVQPTEVAPVDFTAGDMTPTTARAASTTPWMSRMGLAVMLGGGFEDFTNDNLQGMTGGGGAWTGRVVAGTRQIIGLEAAYVGAARSIDGFGLGNDARLVSNGAEGALRANLPVTLGRALVEPFAFIGLGWQHYSLSNGGTVNLSAVNRSDDVMTLPYGGGLEFSYGMLIADARFTYRQTYMNDLMRVGGGSLSTWGISGQLGVEF